MTDDPRGPFRKALKIETTPSVTLVTLDCGHVSHFNQIFQYRVGDDYRCFDCGPHGKPKGE